MALAGVSGAVSLTLARERLASMRESTVRTNSVTQFRETERNDLIPRSNMQLNLPPAHTFVLARRSRAILRADVRLQQHD